MLIIDNIGKIGLNNNGNTCYLNSCIQLITHSGEFVLKLYNYYKKNEGKLNNIENYILEIIIYKWFSNKIIFNPIKIQKELSLKNDIFNPIYCEQQDSSESLIYIIDNLNDIFKNLFKSTFYSILRCKKCKNIRKKIEEFNIWSLEVTNHINSSISQFFNYELLEDELFCEFCKEKTNTEKKYEIINLSNNLIIHYKRFKYDNNTYYKNKNKIYNNDVITINKNNYELRGIIVHNGSIDRGHYYFLGKNLKNEWLNYNDSLCSKVLYDKPIEEGYIFYYEIIKN